LARRLRPQRSGSGDLGQEPVRCANSKSFSYIRGIAKLADQLVILLDLTALFGDYVAKAPQPRVAGNGQLWVRA
jgi:hypothetical protein